MNKLKINTSNLVFIGFISHRPNSLLLSFRIGRTQSPPNIKIVSHHFSCFKRAPPIKIIFSTMIDDRPLLYQLIGTPTSIRFRRYSREMQTAVQLIAKSPGPKKKRRHCTFQPVTRSLSRPTSNPCDLLLINSYPFKTN